MKILFFFLFLYFPLSCFLFEFLLKILCMLIWSSSSLLFFFLFNFSFLLCYVRFCFVFFTLDLEVIVWILIVDTIKNVSWKVFKNLRVQNEYIKQAPLNLHIQIFWTLNNCQESRGVIVTYLFKLFAFI